MTTGVGEVAAGAAARDARPAGDWRERLVVALGGAVVAVVAVLLVLAWSTGLRESTFEQLRADLGDGTVQQWYAAEGLEAGPLDLVTASTSTVRGDLDEAVDDAYLPPKGDPLGGILVWRTWGDPGWNVASESGVANRDDGYRETATEASTALVGQLRAAKVPMKPFEFSDGGWVRGAVVVGGLALVVLLVAGPAPRAGNRWFWFWTMLTIPVGLGFVAYAVVELIGIRRRPDPPLTKRWSGPLGFFGSILVAFLFGVIAQVARSRGVPVPL